MALSETIAPGDELKLTQRVELSSFLGLSLRNGLLNLITLTLYRFWGKTEVRRRLWRSVYVNDEAFEYAGRGIELFLGFMFALFLVVLPFLLAVFAAQLAGPAVAALVIPPLYIVLGFLAGFGRFTAFRYLASRSAWRGIRFWLKGSPFAYAARWLGYGLLSGLTLGWFWPAAQRRLAAPLWDGLRLGDRSFHFDLETARKKKVYPAFALGWVGGLVGYFVLVGMMFAIMAPLAKETADGAPVIPPLAAILKLYAIIGLMAPGYIVLFSPYHAAMLRSIVSGISFEDVRFELRVKWAELAWLTLSNVLLVAFTLGFLMPFVEARTARFLIARLTTEGVVDLSSIRQAAKAGPRTGEGLADAFGVSPI